ncbi:MAG TPA: hypothetical protein VJP86_12515 [Vicinamibacterales bacterium]|nr:hypothetical protein [Vicinamibacterales bacterium]
MASAPSVPRYRALLMPAGPSRHRLVFTVYALDVATLPQGLNKRTLLAAIENHIVAEGTLTGIAER